MARDEGLDKKMNDIAHMVADTLLGNGMVDKETNDAFKILTAYWTAATKLDKIPGDDPDAKSGFGGIKDRLKAV